MRNPINGQQITLTYSKDSSQDKNNDIGKIYNIVVKYTGQVQTGTENKQVARKIKQLYIGVNGVARRVKKAYIGVNGVARLFYEYSPIRLMTTITRPYSAFGAGKTTDYALFAGGQGTAQEDQNKSLVTVVS